MKNLKLKGNFLFIVGISLLAIILFVIGFVTFYTDSSKTFKNAGYIIDAGEKTSDSYDFLSGTKYNSNIGNDISFVDANSKSVSVDPASFVHYSDGSVSYLKNGALIDLDDINKEYVPYYNISDKFLIQYENGVYSISNGTKKLDFSNWIGRISDDKYIVAGKNLRLKIPGVTKEIDGDYFELLFMVDGVVRIDNKDVSYQVTAQGTYIYVGDGTIIDLGKGSVSLGGQEKLLLSQITINGNENIDLDNDDTSSVNGAAGNGGGGSGTDGTGDGSGTEDGTSGTTGNTSGVAGVTSGTEGNTSGTDGNTSGTEGGANNGATNVEDTSAIIDLVKIEVTSTTMDAELLLNNSDLIGGDLVGYLTNVATGERIGSVGITKQDGSFSVCSIGSDCYSFNTILKPSSQYLLTFADKSNNRQYFQRLFSTPDLGLTLTRELVSSTNLDYSIHFDSGTFVSQADLYLYTASDIQDGEDLIPAGTQVYFESGVSVNSVISFDHLVPNSTYKIVLKNISVCNANNECVFDEEYEISRTDTTLKRTPVINELSVKKNVSEASFELSADIEDSDETIYRYIYTICDKTGEDCFTKEKNDGDSLLLTTESDLEAGIIYTYGLTLMYNDGLMDREISYPSTKEFSMESAPYFEISSKDITANSASLVISLHDPSCTVNLQGRNCKGSGDLFSNDFVMKFYKFLEGEEKTIKTINIGRRDFKYDQSSGLYYISTKDSNIDFTGLASETKYAIKIYGTYVLNGEIFEDVQIGDELVFETASTGDLKFVYSANTSNNTRVINYNAGLVGGVVYAEGEDDTEVLDNSINSINKISFTLYAGSYQDDSQSNNRNIGNVFTITGNENIKRLLCSTDPDANTCSARYNFSNIDFGLNNLDELMEATAATNYCGKNVERCLSPTYTIVVTEAKDAVEGGNDIKIEKGTYTYKVTSDFYVNTRLMYDETESAISVNKILKKDFLVSDSTYNFDKLLSGVGNLNNRSSFVNTLGLLDGDTTVGLKVETKMIANYLNATYSYDKVVTNYYICSKGATDCKESAVASYSFESADSMGNSFVNSSHEFYLNDSDFKRGKSYTVMYELEFTDSNGVSRYASNYTSVNVDVYRQAPIYKFYVKDSTNNSIKYGYSINDIDGAISSNDYYFFYKTGGNDYTKIDKTDSSTGTSFVLGNDIRSVNFPICDGACNNVNYSIALKENLLENNVSYVPIVDTVFEGVFTSNSNNDEFELVQFNNDNQLYIIMRDEEGLAARNVLYEVNLKVSNDSIYDRVYLNSKLSKCTKHTDNGICSKYVSDEFRYIAIDYAKIADYLGDDIKVSVKSYFDSGLIGMDQKFTNGVIFRSSIDSKYLNFYGYTGDNNVHSASESVDSYSNGIYYLTANSKKFDSDNVQLYNALDGINSYSNKYGTKFFDGSISTITNDYGYSFSSKGVIWKSIYTNLPKEGFDPKVINVSGEMSSDVDTFKFYSIIPKASVREDNSINTVGLNITLVGVSQETINSGQIKDESGKHYLYIDLYDKDENKVYANPVKVLINCDSDKCSAEHEFVDLDVDSNYYYKIYLDMKSNSNNYSRVEVFDANNTDDYVAKIYETKTFGVNEILDKVGFTAKASAYNSVNDSISDKTITYNVKVKNDKNYKLRLSLYHDDTMIDFNETNGISGNCANGDCFIEIDNIVVGDNINSITFNNNNYVFGDNYYKLKVEAIPYYGESGSGSYDISKKIVLYDESLVTDLDNGIDVHELKYATFNSSVLNSGHDTENNYYVSLKIPSVSDSDYVMKNGEYFVKLFDSQDNVVYYVSNEGSGDNRKAVMREGGASGSVVSELGFVLRKGTIGNVTMIFPNLEKNSGYSIEISYETYRNNVSIVNDDEGKILVDPYTDSVYTPVNEGIDGVVFGNIVSSKDSDTSFKIDYIGGNYLESIKCVSFTSRLTGTYNSISGTISNNSIFTRNSTGYSIVISNENSGSPNLDFSTTGTYYITLKYYKDLLCSNSSEVYSHTTGFVVE